MANYCSNCGVPVNPDALACGNCGAALTSGSGKVFDPEALKLLINRNKTKIMSIARIAVPAVAALIVLVIIICAIAANSGAKGAAKKYFKAIQKQNVEDYIELMPANSKLYYASEEDLYDDVEDSLATTMDYLETEYGKNVKFKIKNIEKDELTNKRFKLITSAYSVNDTLKAIEIEKAYEVEFELSVKGKDDDDKSDASLVLIKEDGDWKVYEASDWAF